MSQVTSKESWQKQSQEKVALCRVDVLEAESLTTALYNENTSVLFPKSVYVNCRSLFNIA